MKKRDENGELQGNKQSSAKSRCILPSFYIVVCFCRLLRQCKHLKLLDVSFCSQLTVEIVEGLQEMYPAVSIKKSFIVEEFAS